MFATIYLPNFFLQAATRHQPELRAKPVALIEEQDRKPIIIQLNEAAEKSGIRKGMTPRFVEHTAPGVCTIQFTGYRDLSPKLAQVIEQLAECEIAAQAAIAPTPDTSFLAAHLARPVLQIENAKEFLAPLPIETLATSSAAF